MSLLKHSRPRFWLYLAGPLLLGVSWATGEIYQLASPTILLALLIFLYPANIFLYGVNDLADGYTDALNKKKEKKEARVKKRKRLIMHTIGGALCVLLLAFSTKHYVALSLFLLLSLAYSLPPIRLKAKPFLDSLSNVLYITPGIFTYTLFTQQFPTANIIAAAWCWVAAMHLFSAIPDITPDYKAGVVTTAVFLGQRRSLVLCSVLWLASGVLLLHPLMLIALPYVILPLTLLNASTEKILQRYWKFPYLNAVVGFLLFWFPMLFTVVVV